MALRAIAATGAVGRIGGGSACPYPLASADADTAGQKKYTQSAEAVGGGWHCVDATDGQLTPRSSDVEERQSREGGLCTEWQQEQIFHACSSTAVHALAAVCMRLVCMVY